MRPTFFCGNIGAAAGQNTPAGPALPSPLPLRFYLGVCQLQVTMAGAGWGGVAGVPPARLSVPRQSKQRSALPKLFGLGAIS